MIDNGNITTRQISEKLNERIHQVIKHLNIQGVEKEGRLVFGNKHGDPGQSAALNLSGQHIGKWRDWSGDDRGDLLDLWSHSRSMALPKAIQEAKQWLGIRDGLQEKKKTYQRPKSDQKQIELNPEGLALKWFRENRLILPETVAQFKVNGAEGGMLIFPSYSIEGELINRFYRKLDKTDEHQEKGCAPALFGWQALNPRAFTNRTVIICEGQIDAMTWTQWGFDCLSIPNGAKNFNWVDFEWDNLQAFDTIYISFDMDEQGRAGAETAVERLGMDRVLLVQLPAKDANDCLKMGLGADDAAKWIASAKPKRMEGLSDASEYLDEVVEVFFPNPDAEKENFTPKMLQTERGGISFRPGELTVWTGHSGHGKTTLLSYLAAIDICLRGKVYFMASMEMLPKKILAKMVLAALNKVPSHPDEVRRAMQEYSGRIHFAKELGFIDQKDLFNMMAYCRKRYGMTASVIDSLMAVSGLEEEYSSQNDFLSALARMAKTTGTHIHLVCHPRKGDESLAPGMMDVKGSSTIFNRADNVISVQRSLDKIKAERDGMPPDKLAQMPDVLITSAKDRENGWRGQIELYYNWRTCTYSKHGPMPNFSVDKSK